jgi:hypothetical protein
VPIVLGESVLCVRPVRFRAGAKIIAKSNLRLVAPDAELRTVTLRRHSNRDMGRDREHLTEHEVERLIKVARGNRYGQRDATMILTASGMAFACRSFAGCSGHRLRSRPPRCTCAAPKAARKPRIPS